MENFLFVIHIGSLCIAACGILAADLSASAWLLGKRNSVDHSLARIAHIAVTLGLVGLVTSGLLLFWPERAFLIRDPLFLVKMGFVIALLVNGIAIERLLGIAIERPFRSLQKRERVQIIVSGIVSTISWIGAFVIAVSIF